jgi:hypothetical protein
MGDADVIIGRWYLEFKRCASSEEEVASEEEPTWQGRFDDGDTTDSENDNDNDGNDNDDGSDDDNTFD